VSGDGSSARASGSCSGRGWLAPEELAANLLTCVVLAEKLLNDAPSNDLVSMIAAALSRATAVGALRRLEFRVLSVHEGTIVGAVRRWASSRPPPRRPTGRACVAASASTG